MALGPQAQGKTADGEGDTQATPILACLRNDSASNPRTNLGGGRNRGFRLRKKNNPLTAYIAATRVLDRADILILPFPAEPFQGGDNSFREYLLRHLRGEDLDWQTILATYCKVKTCSECKAARRMSDFSEAQKKQPQQIAVCKECTRTYRELGTPTRCSRCLRWRAAECFPGKTANFHSWARTTAKTSPNQAGLRPGWDKVGRSGAGGGLGIQAFGFLA